MYFSFNFGWYSIQLDIVSIKNWRNGRFMLNRQNLLGMTDVILEITLVMLNRFCPLSNPSTPQITCRWPLCSYTLLKFASLT